MSAATVAAVSPGPHPDLAPFARLLSAARQASAGHLEAFPMIWQTTPEWGLCLGDARWWDSGRGNRVLFDLPGFILNVADNIEGREEGRAGRVALLRLIENELCSRPEF